MSNRVILLVFVQGITRKPTKEVATGMMVVLSAVKVTELQRYVMFSNKLNRIVSYRIRQGIRSETRRLSGGCEKGRGWRWRANLSS